VGQTVPNTVQLASIIFCQALVNQVIIFFNFKACAAEFTNFSPDESKSFSP
jgi:hypothetical protein